jgi:uncharacterized membrane protein YccF (DUF307 family)
MSLLGIVCWIVLGGGILLFLEFVIGGLLLRAITIIGIPFAKQHVKLAAQAPFGKSVR